MIMRSEITKLEISPQSQTCSQDFKSVPILKHYAYKFEICPKFYC